MADKNEIEHIVERVVTQVLQGHLSQLREELVRRVLQELPQASMEGARQLSGHQSHDARPGCGATAFTPLR